MALNNFIPTASKAPQPELSRRRRSVRETHAPTFSASHDAEPNIAVPPGRVEVDGPEVERMVPDRPTDRRQPWVDRLG